MPLGGLQLGFGVERVTDLPGARGETRGVLSISRLSFGAATSLGERLSLGFAARTHTGVAGSPSSWDAGLLYRLWSWLFLAWRVTGMTGSPNPISPSDQRAFSTRYSWGFALRPFSGSDRLTFAWDITWPAGIARTKPHLSRQDRGRLLPFAYL